MKYYSTNHQSPVASLEEAVVKGLASDKGLFMPEAVKMLPEVWGIERSGFFNGREKWAKGFENQRV